MPDIERISVQDARDRAGRGALLVCGYDDDAKCGRIRLQDAITMSELRPRLQNLSREQEIIVYCA